jgi:inosine-uridine nucleoside N-ribohydrolase
MKSPEPITILALEPLTNLAVAICLEPRLKDKVKEIILMGGAVRVPGNKTPCAFFNMAVDPEKAHIVYHSVISIVQVGLNVCDQVTQTVEDLATIEAAHTPTTNWLIRVLDLLRSKPVINIIDDKGNKVRTIQGNDQGVLRGQGIGLNDLITAGFVINPGWFESQNVCLDGEIHGALTYAQTIEDFSGL